MAGAANCWLSPPHRWCSRASDGHLVDCCWEGVPLAGVVIAYQCLCQLETEGLHTLSAPASSWPALPHQDEGICDAAIHKEPEDVPVVSKLHSHLCMTETMYLCIHELIHFLFTECMLLFVFVGYQRWAPLTYKTCGFLCEFDNSHATGRPYQRHPCAGCRGQYFPDRERRGNCRPFPCDERWWLMLGRREWTSGRQPWCLAMLSLRGFLPGGNGIRPSGGQLQNGHLHVYA